MTLHDVIKPPVRASEMEHSPWPAMTRTITRSVGFLCEWKSSTDMLPTMTVQIWSENHRSISRQIKSPAQNQRFQKAARRCQKVRKDCSKPVHSHWARGGTCFRMGETHRLNCHLKCWRRPEPAVMHRVIDLTGWSLVSMAMLSVFCQTRATGGHLKSQELWELLRNTDALMGWQNRVEIARIGGCMELFVTFTKRL